MKKNTDKIATENEKTEIVGNEIEQVIKDLEWIAENNSIKKPIFKKGINFRKPK